MSTTLADKRITTLLDLLAELTAGHRELRAAVEGKIAAMRAGDPAAIRDAALVEQGIAQRLTERENLRRQLTVNIARGYGVGVEAARRMSAAQLAERIGGPDAERLREAAGGLKALVAEVARRNHVAELIAQNVLRHVKLAFAAMTAGAQTTTGYSPGGETRMGANELILDAVG